ncbi:MAG: aa3-type cytochrome c oxidase subunit IV [Alphaproteobacteria bacterium]|jgi:hypothetical protein
MEDFQESVRRHQSGWESFAGLLLWSSIFVIIVLALMAIFLL